MRLANAMASLGICLLIGLSAHAELRLCNDSPFSIDTAIGYPTAEGWQSKGWWTIEAGACAVVIGGDLTNRYYYFHGQTSDGSYTWGGNFSFCTTSTVFTITDNNQCEPRGFQLSRFDQIDTGNNPIWTQRLTCDGCKIRNGLFLSFALPNVPGDIEVYGRRFILPVSARAKADFSGPSLATTVIVDSDLSDFQAGIPDIIRSQLNHNDDCNYILNLHTISLTPYGTSLRIYTAGHYEDWECPWMDTPFGRLDLGKHRLFEQNGDITAFVTPHTDGTSVWLNVNVGAINADGLLGNVLDTDWFGPWIRDMIVQSLPQVVQIGRIVDVLPPALRDATIRILDISFYDRGGGRLGLRTSASATVSQEYAASVWNQLQ